VLQMNANVKIQRKNKVQINKIKLM